MNKEQHNRIKTIRKKHTETSHKHLRGRHDQRDHAWNRGMGRGGSSAIGGGGSPVITAEDYRKQSQSLMNMVREGQISISQARSQLKRLRELASNPSAVQLPQTSMPVSTPATRPASGGLAGMTRQVAMASRSFNFAASLYAESFIEDSARFQPENKINPLLLRKFPFMRRMIDRAADKTAAQTLYNDTETKMAEAVSKPTSLWDIAKQAYLAERIQGEKRNLEQAQQMDLLGLGKRGIAQRQQQLTKLKNQFYEVSKKSDDAIRAKLGPRNPGRLGTPAEVQGFTPIDEARVYAALAKVGASIDASVLKTRHGGPVAYRVIGAELGETRTLAYHQYDESIDPVTGAVMPMSTIVINTSKLNEQSIESAIAHEMGHALVAQLDTNFVNAHTEYLQSRLQGEQLKYNNDTGELYYEDLYSRYYPGVVMSGGDPRFAGTEFEDTIMWGRNELGIPDYIYPTETISTGLEEYITDPVGLMMRDADLFMHLNSLFNGTSGAYSATPPVAPGTTPPVAPGTTPPVAPGTTPPVAPGTTPPVAPGTSTSAIYRDREGRPVASSDGVFLDEGTKDVKTTALAISPTTVGTGGYGTGKYIGVTYPQTRVIDGVPVTETKRATGRRKAPYIDEMPVDSLPEALRNNPDAVARIAHLQRYYDFHSARAKERKFSNPDKYIEQLLAAKAAAEMFRIFPDARLLDDVLDAFPRSESMMRSVENRLTPEEVQEFRDLYDFADYWTKPAQYEVINKGTPNEGIRRIDVAMPDNIRRFGIPGQSLSPAVDIFPDNSSQNPRPGRPYVHTQNDNSIYNIKQRGDALGNESFISDSVYDSVRNLDTNNWNRIHQIPSPKAPRPKTPTSGTPSTPSTPSTIEETITMPSADASMYLSDNKTDNGIRITNPQIGMSVPTNFATETNADGQIIPTRRNTPYIDEVDTSSLPEDFQELVPIIGKLQRSYDEQAIIAMTQRGTPEGSRAALNAAEIAAMTFQVFPDVTLLSNAESIVRRIDESSLSGKEKNRLKNLSAYAKFWRNPRKNDITAAPIPGSIQKYGAPGFDIYEDMAIERNSDGTIIGNGKTALDLVNSEEYQSQDFEMLNQDLYNQIVEGMDPPKSKRVDAKKPVTPESLLPTTPETTPSRPSIDVLSTDLPPLPPSAFDAKPRVDGETRTIASNVIGNQTTAYGPTPDKPYQMRHRVLDIREVIPSTTLNGTPNPAYDSRLQPRDRSRVASRTQVNEIANKFLPSWMINDTNKLDDGSPIIDNEGQVLSGNGRTIAMQQLATTPEGRKKLEQYKKELLEKADEYGLSKEDIEKMEIPILVREVANDIDKEALAREANKPRTGVMPEKDQARADAEALPDSFLAAFDSNTDDTNFDRILNSPSNLRLRQMLIANLPATERTGLVKADGSGLTFAGLNRLKAAMYAKIFDGENSDVIIDAITENPDDDFKRINLGIAGSLAGLGNLKAGINDGSRPPEYQKFIDDIGTAVSMYSKIRESDELRAMPIDDAIRFLMGGDMFSDVESLRMPLDAENTEILRFLHENRNQQKTIREFFNDITNQMTNQDDYRQSRADGIEPPSYQNILQIALQRAAERKANADAAREARQAAARDNEQVDMFGNKSFKSDDDINTEIKMLNIALKSFIDYARAADRNTPKFKLLNSFALRNLDTLSALINTKKIKARNNS